jgi:hypothetical protein
MKVKCCRRQKYDNTVRLKFVVNVANYRDKFSVSRICKLYKLGRLGVGGSIILKLISKK